MRSFEDWNSPSATTSRMSAFPVRGMRFAGEENLQAADAFGEIVLDVVRRGRAA